MFNEHNRVKSNDVNIINVTEFFFFFSVYCSVRNSTHTKTDIKRNDVYNTMQTKRLSVSFAVNFTVRPRSESAPVIIVLPSAKPHQER